MSKKKEWIEELADKPSEESSKDKKDMTAAHMARKKKAAARAKSLREQVQEVLDSERVDRELKLKLRYCQNQIDQGRTDFVVARRTELIREAARRFPTA